MGFFYVQSFRVYLCIRGKEGEEYMPPLEKKIMDETHTEIKALLSEMRILHKAQEEKQELWEKLIGEQTNNNKERLAIIDRRWNNLMRIVITLCGLFLVSFISDTISLGKRPTISEVNEIINEGDFASKDDVIGGDYSIIDDMYENLERETDMTHDQARVDKSESKLKAFKGVTGYKARSIKSN